MPARLDELRRVTDFVGKLARHAGFDGLQLSQIELAVDEACSNIIQHAYGDYGHDSIYVHVFVQPRQRIVITLVDTGAPFDPGDVPVHDPNAALDDMKVGGLGLYLMRQTMDDVRFEFNLIGLAPGEPARFNRLTLVKDL